MTSPENPTMPSWPYPPWIAHRGAGQLAPENTLAAFRCGASFGLRAFECDVKLSADGEPFLLHDSTLERTTTGQGIASEKTWAELSQLDAGGWHSPAFAGEPLPRFEAIARYCLQNSFALNIEIKPTPGDDARTGQRVALAAQGLWAGPDAVAPLLSSFQAEALHAAQAAAPELPRALLLETLHEGWFEQARRLACTAVVTHHKLMNAALVAQLHGAGMRAVVYTVNDAARAQQLLAMGVDSLITDAVDRLPQADR